LLRGGRDRLLLLGVDDLEELDASLGRLPRLLLEEVVLGRLLTGPLLLLLLPALEALFEHLDVLALLDEALDQLVVLEDFLLRLIDHVLVGKLLRQSMIAHAPPIRVDLDRAGGSDVKSCEERLTKSSHY
jgi:hypothetical protein